MKIAVTADWHGYIPPEVPECDLMVVAGDIGLGEKFSYDPEVLLSDLWKWIEAQLMPIVVVAGNHDFHPEILRNLPWTYLQDESVEINGLTIWGSPWSNPFGYDWAFNMTEQDQEELFKQIPDHTDIIISHGPPHEFCDLVGGYYDLRAGLYMGMEHVGSKALRTRMEQLPNLKLVACGHVHPRYGKENIVVNGSLVNDKYQVANKPYVVEV